MSEAQTASAVSAGSRGPDSSGYIPGFDGLRAIAVSMVLVAHAGYGRLVPGGLGVTIFFAISGYLITSLLVGEFARHGTINLRLFYARRILRLYPELIALMLLCLIAGLAFDWQATIAEKLGVILYYMNYYSIFGEYHPVRSYPWEQLWSLAVEEHFYIFFPDCCSSVRARRDSGGGRSARCCCFPFSGAS